MPMPIRSPPKGPMQSGSYARVPIVSDDVPLRTCPPRKNTWMGTSWLMMTDILGTSILTLPGVARQLGWVLTGVFIICLCPVSIYTALLMSKTRQALAESQNVEPLTMGEAARYTLGGDRAASIVYAVVYGFAFLGNGSYLLTMGNALQGVFYDHVLCLPYAVLCASLCCLPVVIFVRHLSDSVGICFANLFMLLAVLIIVMVKMAWEGPLEGAQTFLIAEDLTALIVFGAMTNIVYSYAGQWVYFEIMAEMSEPNDFPKVFYINAPLQVGLYLLVAYWGYYFTGDQTQGYFLNNLPWGNAFRMASLLLFIHVGIAFLIKNVIVARHLHKSLSPDRVDVRLGETGGVRAHLEYVACAAAVMVGGALLALTIPFFSDLLGLLGGLLSGPISFVLPMALFAGARAIATQKTALLAEEGGFCRNCHPKITEMLRAFPLPHLLLSVLIGSFILLTMFVGTSSVVQDILAKSAYNMPFSCVPLGPPMKLPE